MDLTQQRAKSADLGRAAFHAGKPCSPALDRDFLDFLSACDKRRVGLTPPGEAPTLALLTAWIDHWRAAQAAAQAAAPAAAQQEAAQSAQPRQPQAFAPLRQAA